MQFTSFAFSGNPGGIQVYAWDFDGDNVKDAIISQFKPLVPGSNTFFSYVSNVDKVRARGVEVTGLQLDHAELLARKVAAQMGRPCWSVLVREPGPPQTGRTLLERRDGPEFTPRRTVRGASVLLVDDVVTTGATLAAAARALRTVGAARVIGAAAAHPR